MILLVGGIKGGSGKSTVAVNLAILRSQAGSDLLLVDADDQETATDFTMLRNETGPGAGYTSVKLNGSSLRTEIMRLKEKYDDIIIDTGGRDTTSQRAAMSIADSMLIPFTPQSFDIWTVEKLGTVIEEMKTVNFNLQVYSFLNKCFARGLDNMEAGEALSEVKDICFLNSPIGTRKAFTNAASQGLCVSELKPRDTKAVKELQNLYDQIYVSN